MTSGKWFIAYVRVMFARLLFIFHLLPIFISAQETDTVPLVRSFGAAYQNDLLTASFDTTTDYYYTGGTFFELNLRWLERNPVSRILVCLPHGRNESFGIGYAHVAYTPTNIESDSILVGDRPFSGAIYVGLNRVSCDSAKRMRLTSRLDVGAMGPISFAYQTQKFIHAHTNNPEPRGWQYQIENDLYLNYSVRLEKGLITNNAFELIGYGSTNIGTIYMNATGGMKIRAGRMQGYFETPGYTHRFLLWGYTTGECRLIGRDATLQGGLINRNSAYCLTRDNINRAVFMLTVGAVACYHKFRVEYFNAFLSPEFSAGKTHAWGHLGVQYFF